MKNLSKLILATCSLMIMLSINVSAQEAKAEKQILIKNVSIFNGNSGKLITGKDVVVEGNKIKSIVSSGGNEGDFDEVIDGKGGYLSPGMIDCHAHAVMGGDENTFINGDQNYVQLFAAMEMEDMLLRGVTTIRDAGGNTFALKKAIDDGIVDGPRIYPSGAILSQYSGHVDFRTPNPTDLPKEWGGQISPGEKNGHAMLANGPDQVMTAVRQQLFLGATQIKLAVGGGVSSFTDPLYVNEYTSAEIKAAVDAAPKMAGDMGHNVLAQDIRSNQVAGASGDMGYAGDASGASDPTINTGNNPAPMLRALGKPAIMLKKGIASMCGMKK